MIENADGILRGKLFGPSSILDFLCGYNAGLYDLSDDEIFINLNNLIDECIAENLQSASSIRFTILMLICENVSLGRIPAIQNIFSRLLTTEPTLANEVNKSGNILSVYATVYMQLELLKLLKQNGADMRKPITSVDHVEDPTSMERYIDVKDTPALACIRRITPSCSPFYSPVEPSTAEAVMSLVAESYTRRELYEFMQRNDISDQEVFDIVNKTTWLDEVMLTFVSPGTIRTKNGRENAPVLRDFLDRDEDNNRARLLRSFLG